MSTFDNVSVVKAANQYFDGKVTSRKVIFADNTEKTLGIMMPGEYEFGTELKELMEITSGEMDILLNGEQQWQTITSGQEFYVPANSSFKIKAHSVIDYICSYIAE